MPVPWAALASVAGPIIGGLFGQQGARDSNAANLDVAREQMGFQERMSNTAHQREVTDLKAAGLNPILSANAGASSPAGASATMQNVNESLNTSAVEASKALQNSIRQSSELELMKAQKDKTQMETTVLSKEIPRAEMTNKAYEAAKRIVEKIAEGNSASAKRMSEKEKSDLLNKIKGVKSNNPFTEGILP